MVLAGRCAALIAVSSLMMVAVAKGGQATGAGGVEERPGWEVLSSGPDELYQKKPPTKKHKPKQTISAKESAAMRREAREAIRAGEFDRAERLLRKAVVVKKRSERQAWLLLEAELEIARERWAKAGLAAMRLVILHPGCERVGAAQYWAGRAYEGLERPRLAAVLYERSVSAKKAKSSIRERAKARLAAIRKRVPRR